MNIALTHSHHFPVALGSSGLGTPAFHLALAAGPFLALDEAMGAYGGDRRLWTRPESPVAFIWDPFLEAEVDGSMG